MSVREHRWTFVVYKLTKAEVLMVVWVQETFLKPSSEMTLRKEALQFYLVLK
jgi:hypothetical protein